MDKALKHIALALLLSSFLHASISFHAAGGTNNTTSGTFTVTVGTVSNNDIVLLFLVNSSGTATTAGSSWSLPAGYTACYNNRGYALAYHLWLTGDSTSLSVTKPAGAGSWSSGKTIEYSGVDTTTPVDQCTGAVFSIGSLTLQNFSPNTRVHTGGVFPNYANDMMLVFYGDASASGSAFSLSNSAGWTARFADTSGPNEYSWEQQLSNNNARGSVDAIQAGTAANRFSASVLLKTSADSATGRQGPVAGYVGSWALDNVSSFDLLQYGVANNDFVTMSCIGTTPKAVSTTGYATTINQTHIAVYTHLWLTGDSTTVSLTGTGACGLNLLRNISNGIAITVDATGTATGASVSTINAPSLGVTCSDFLLLDYYSSLSTSPTWSALSGSSLNWGLNNSTPDSVDELETYVESPSNPTGAIAGTQNGSGTMGASSLALKISGGVGCTSSGSYFPQMR